MLATYSYRYLSARTDGTRSVQTLALFVQNINARTTCHTVWTLNREADIDIQLNSKGSYLTRPLTCLSLRTEYLYVLLQNNTTLVCLNSTRQKTLFGQAPNLPDYDVIQVPKNPP